MTPHALCSPFLPEEIRRKIEEISGTDCIAIPPYSQLPKPICHHPDMLFFNPPARELTISSECYHAVNLRFFDQFPTASLLLDDVRLDSGYPLDIAFDAIGINGTVYCLEAFTAETVKKQFGRTISIKQGYAACSTLILNDRTAVTADTGIAKALTNDGIRVLKISPDGVSLPGYGCGFIGGASAVINDTAIFFGNLKNHPSGEEITELCRAEGINVTDFPRLPLTDYGGIRYLYT